MALPKKGTGSGTTVELSTDGSTWTKLLSVTKVGAPEYTRDTVDVTDNGSYESNNQMKEFVASFIDGGELTVEGFVRSDDETGLAKAEEAFFNGDMVQVRVVGPKWLGKTFVYPGLITSFKPIGDMDPENGVPYSLTTKVTGKPTVTKTAGG